MAERIIEVRQDHNDGKEIYFTQSETVKRKKYCKGCIYNVYTGGESSSSQSCDYMNITGHRRNCKGPLHSKNGKCEARVIVSKEENKKKIKKKVNPNRRH